MRVFRLLSARRLRQQPLRAGIATVAVAAAVSLAVAIVVTTASIERSVADFGRSLAGPAPLRVVGPTTEAGLTADAVARAEEVPGVAALVPMIQAVTFADDVVEDRSTGSARISTEVPVLALGVDCRVEAVLGTFGCDPAILEAAGDRPVVVGPGLAGAEDATLRTNTGRVALGGVPVLDALADLNDGRVVVFGLAAAQRAFVQPGLVDVAYVVPEPGADHVALRAELEEAVGSHNAVRSATDPPAQTQVILLTFLPLFGLLGIFGLGTGAVLVHNTVSLSMEERRRQLAVLGALGATRRTVVGGAVGEAAVLGLLGGALGVGGGILVARPIVASLSNFTEASAGITLEDHLPGSAILIGVLLGGLVGAGAALLPARRAMRADVAAELSGRGGVAEAKPLRLLRRTLLWGGLGVIGSVACWSSQLDGGIERWQASVGPLGFLAVALAMPLTGATIAPLLIGWVARATRRTRRAPVLLAMADLVRDPRRAGVMAIAVTSPIIIGFATDGFVSSAKAGIEGSLGETSDGVSLSTVDVNGGFDSFLSADAQAAIAALPGVAELHRGLFFTVGTEVDEFIGVSAYEGTDLTGSNVVLGTADVDRLRAGEVLIGPGLARRTGARPGDTVEVPTPTGIVSLPVQGVLRTGNFNGYGVTMDFDHLGRLYGERPPGFIVAEPEAGVPEADVATTILEAAPTIDPQLGVLTTDELVDEIADSIDTQMAPFRAMRAALQVVAFVAVLSTLLLAGYQRRREHGVLAAVGARPPDLGRVVLAQAGIIGVAAVATAAVLGPALLWSMLQVIPILIGQRDPFEPNWMSLATGAVLGIGIAVVAGLWPAWRAGRVEVLDALRYE